MGRRDFWPNDKDYWNKWSEYNRDYWRKWAEHNKDYWNNNAHRYARHCGRGRWLGRIVLLGVGFWAGMHVAKRHQLPPADHRDAWVEIKATAERMKDGHQDLKDSPELQEIIEKVKQFEKRFRKPQASDEKQPPSSGDQPPRSSE